MRLLRRLSRHCHALFRLRLIFYRENSISTSIKSCLLVHSQSVRHMSILFHTRSGCLLNNQRDIVQIFGSYSTYVYAFLHPNFLPHRLRASTLPPTVPSAPAFTLPLFLPVLTSLRLAQQQHCPTCTSHPAMAHPLAIHMNANILVPSSGTILTSASALRMTLVKITNMTVAMVAATVVKRAERKVRMAMGRVAHRDVTPRGARRIAGTVVEAPVRKRANIQWEARRTSFKAEMISLGSATFQGGQQCHVARPSSGLLPHSWCVLPRAFNEMKTLSRTKGWTSLLVAPERSSLRIISTGLNQYNVFGSLQSVISFPYPSQ